MNVFVYNSARDKNQEEFERIKEAMASKETDYANKLSNIANDINMKNSRKKQIDTKENFHKMRREEDEELYKNSKKNQDLKELQNKKLYDTVQNMKFKYEKLKEFTNQDSVEALTTKFKNQAEENYQLFVKITEISKEAKECEREIKELEEEIRNIKNSRDGKKNEEDSNLIGQLKSKIDSLRHQKEKIDTEHSNRMKVFEKIKDHVKSIFFSLKCQDELSEKYKYILEGINENNIIIYITEIEKKLKVIQKFYEIEHMNKDDEEFVKKVDVNKPNVKKLNNQLKKAIEKLGSIIVI